ncbi:hypothetical protein H9623_02335 [Oerskovia sp. Sa1BUA8]|uniref:Uncharacterized protein n=1 Tax=Oerskovia douganii TaxID=2762210 RepID=A0A9D5YXG4_9CELL|nr:hypothetical protein [Oerskovia douganii]MBE7699145.1 hypothetical protein [Oerskovia douganii]
MSTTTHPSATLHAPARQRATPTRTNRAGAAAPRRPDLERQSITFTIGLYLFICTALLGTHLLASGHAAAPAPAATTSSSDTAPSGVPPVPAAAPLTVTP